MSLAIGDVIIPGRVLTAPMTGVSDLPFRRIASACGAPYVATEMVACDSFARGRPDVVRRAAIGDGLPLMVVQLVGREPEWIAKGAKLAEQAGAHIIDFNMGCPAKKVCNTHAGSALLRDEVLVGRILESVVQAVSVPVTLKFRTGWDKESRNALTITRIAEQSGIRLLSLHGRTRACGYSGHAEYDTIREVKRATQLPVVANGDICSPQEAQHVLQYTGADGVMIGRAAQGRPWIFREIAHFLDTGEELPPPLVTEIHQVLVEHLHALYAFYGRDTGVRIARKHISWYTKGLANSASFRHMMNRLESCEQQLAAVDAFFLQVGQQALRLQYVSEEVSGEASMAEAPLQATLNQAALDQAALDQAMAA